MFQVLELLFSILWWRWMMNWWWWIVFVVYLTNERGLALFLIGAIVKDHHHYEFLTYCKQDLNLWRTSPALVELSCAVVITTTSQLHCDDEPSCNGAACNISSVIWQSPPFGNIFCSALLKVCISFNKHIWFEISWNWSYD